MKLFECMWNGKFKFQNVYYIYIDLATQTYSLYI